MPSNHHHHEDDLHWQRAARPLQSWHQQRFHGGLFATVGILLAFLIWATFFQMDEVAQARGEVIASSRVQVIQSVDGGVLSRLEVKEGDRVQPGQILARLDQTRFGASVGEIEARVFALKARRARLQAEVSDSPAPRFDSELLHQSRETSAVELALFKQRRIGLTEDLRILTTALDLARKELLLVDRLYSSGDASGTEVLRAQRSVNDAEARLVARKNKFMEDARTDLSKAEDDLAQNEQVLMKKRQEQADTVFVAQVGGIVKNIRMTTVGGVLRAGDELMQIVPVDDELVVEAKFKPSDIARIHPGLTATLRLDSFDYTVFGSIKARVSYVSADTIKEDTKSGTETYYRVHVVPQSFPVVSSVGRSLEIQPGMTAQVDIRTGERSLLNYLLKPLRKTLTESMGER